MVTRAKTTPKTEPAAAAAAPSIETTAAPAPEAATKSVDQVVTYTKEQVEKMGKQVFQAYDDLNGFHKENVDAMIQSGNILAKGLETLSKAMVAYTQSQVEQSVAATKAMMGVKTLRELVDLQTEFARTSFDTMIAEATKVSELSVKVANEAIEPLSARVNATVEKLSKPIAA